MDNRVKLDRLFARTLAVGAATETIGSHRVACRSVVANHHEKRSVHYRWAVDGKRVSSKQIEEMFGYAPSE